MNHTHLKDVLRGLAIFTLMIASSPASARFSVLTSAALIRSTTIAIRIQLSPCSRWSKASARSQNTCKLSGLLADTRRSDAFFLRGGGP